LPYEVADLRNTDEVIILKYDKLLVEAESNNLIVRERPLRAYDGRIRGKKILIRSTLTVTKKTCVLAEELGHYYTTVGDILNQEDVSNVKQENKARAWAYGKLVPMEELKHAFDAGYRSTYEIAEYLDIDEGFLKESLDHYTAKYGQSFFGQIDEETRLQTLFGGSSTGNVPKWLLDLLKG